jgi:N-acetylmuramic acid 6-phosphate etherase
VGILFPAVLMHPRASDFLKVATHFKLGHLMTESFHPLTTQLSALIESDLSSGLALLQEVDRLALELMREKELTLWQLAQDIQDTLGRGQRVFLVGCGATGRLSLVLETLFRQIYQTDQVCAFMAGGDFALIKSVESFEDKTDYGARQLRELGFQEGDLLLAPTEGGETPFVIGATLEASRLSKRKPYFLYCNPDELLMPIARSREIIENAGINKVNLAVGPMAISGSTRMQASTVLMLGIGVGLLQKFIKAKDFSTYFQKLLSDLISHDYRKLAPLTALESSLYQEKKFLNYHADSTLAISILTDTTERSPTFSLRGFENRLDETLDHSLSYLFVKGAEGSEDAWRHLLQRAPRALEWDELSGRINLRRIYGFDISKAGASKRSSEIPTEDFNIELKGTVVRMSCLEKSVEFQLSADPLYQHLVVKMLLNAHSTSIMGALGRYEGNVMTWVRPSNNKLIDRSARYILQLLKQRGISPTYEEVIEKIFEEIEKARENEPVVMKVVARY